MWVRNSPSKVGLSRFAPHMLATGGTVTTVPMTGASSSAAAAVETAQKLICVCGRTMSMVALKTQDSIEEEQCDPTSYQQPMS